MLLVFLSFSFLSNSDDIDRAIRDICSTSDLSDGSKKQVPAAKRSSSDDAGRRKSKINTK